MISAGGGDDEQGERERRRCRRFRLEIAVNVHLGGFRDPVMAAIIDIGAKGVRLRARAAPLNPPVQQGNGRGPLRMQQEGAFGFVSLQQHICVANGRILRIGQDANGDGEFVLSVERANAAFHRFLTGLSEDLSDGVSD
jgi:PilZ domain